MPELPARAQEAAFPNTLTVFLLIEFGLCLLSPKSAALKPPETGLREDLQGSHPGTGGWY